MIRVHNNSVDYMFMLTPLLLAAILSYWLGRGLLRGYTLCRWTLLPLARIPTDRFGVNRYGLVVSSEAGFSGTDCVLCVSLLPN